MEERVRPEKIFYFFRNSSEGGHGRNFLNSVFSEIIEAIEDDRRGRVKNRVFSIKIEEA
jgi:hypothetical protein